jgi:hypothetical protein
MRILNFSMFLPYNGELFRCTDFLFDPFSLFEIPQRFDGLF